jgi:transcriptional regulator with PAS, ATPase and Fis domain
MSHEHPAIILDSLNLETAERRLCEEALARAGSIVAAAKLLGITRHALRRRIEKLRIEWPRGQPSGVSMQLSP